jgi:hypothetical protein
MSKDEIRDIVIAALQEHQQASGRPWQVLKDDMTPIGALPGFDSLSGIEATISIEQRLNHALDSETVFEDGRRAFTISEICDSIAKGLSSVGVA